MASSLQEQLLKAGLAKKASVNEVSHKQAKQRKGKPPQARAASQADAARAKQAERDRALAAEKNARLKQKELRAQARQIIEANRVKREEGEIEYAFAHHGKVRRILVDAAQRAQLISGALLVVRLGQRYELVPRAAGLKLREREPSLVVLDHAETAAAAAENTAEDDYYRQFEVPDDLTW